MKKTIIATTLKLIPKAFQYKALCKALNYICVEQDLSQFSDQIIKLTISDINISWLVTCDKNRFKLTKNRNVNLEIVIDLNTAMNLQRKTIVMQAVNRESIQFKGELNLVNQAKYLLCQIDEKRLVSLSSHLFSFLKIKSFQPARIDINTVQLNDLKSELDIDFIRDEAVRLEKVDLEKALSLMLLAHRARPSGPFISKKIAEYREALNAP